jgi:hypothetical protein
VPILEYPDVVLPTLLGININYMTGLLMFTFDETIDTTPAAVTVLLSEIAMIDWRGTNTYALDTYTGADIGGCPVFFPVSVHFVFPFYVHFVPFIALFLL